MALRASKPSFNVREKLTELGRRFGLKGSELAAAETVQEARDLVSAGRKNLVINGSMSIAQRGVGPVTVSNNTYQTVDRFKTWLNYSSGTVQISQDSDAPSGFTKSLKYTSSATAAQYHILSQIIEANNLGHIKAGTSDALPLTVSFWVKSNRTGNFNFEIVDDDGSHHIVKQYTINNSGQWEYKSIFIPPNTSGGVMTIDNTTGYELFWFLGSSTSYSGTALTDNWASFSTTRRNTGGNVTLNSGDYWQITGVQLEVGKNATEFEHRHYGEELKLCERYYEYSSAGTGRFYTIRNDGISRGTVTWRTVKRATPNSVTLTHSNPSGWSSATVLGKDRYGMDFGSSGNYSNFASYACDAEL